MGGAFGKGLHPHHDERLINTLTDLRRGQPEVCRAEGHILFNGHANNLIIGVLKNHSHPAPDLFEVFVIPGIHSVNDNSPPARGKQRIQMLDQRGLTAAIGTDQGDMLPFVNFHMDILQNRHVLIIITIKKLMDFNHDNFSEF